MKFEFICHAFSALLILDVGYADKRNLTSLRQEKLQELRWKRSPRSMQILTGENQLSSVVRMPAFVLLVFISGKWGDAFSS
ncbi:hypothetical protein DM860_006650 [Cuscuta australis]|uniref:Uncharacterized protein n=1 Tax=Cuscuta australis TaxID=267555 RepID=A0A328D602_9ASTE|nr:hypothetical protein DM860_006650 [Cuscuta australis]